MRLRLSFLGIAAGSAFAFATSEANAHGDGPYAGPFSWTGFYIGAAAGYGTGTAKVTNNPGVAGDFDTSIRGGQGILSLGYDYRAGPKFVVGVLADYAFGDLDGTTAGSTFTVDKQWAIGARLGFLSTRSTLWFATAGWTRADFEIDAPALTRTLDGYFVGAGVEQAFTPNLSLKVEYRFSNYEDFQPDSGSPLTIDNDVQSIRLGLNWTFGGREERAPIK
jgi:outer membrane immunogenic protein